MSTSTSWNSSTSEPTYLETPENLLINQLSGVAAGLAQQMNAWAQQQYAKTSAITEQAVGNFFQVSQRMLGFSNSLTDQYNNLFAPQNAQLVAEANSYASPARMQVNMGMAGATQAQAGEAALRNSERDLLSYGIDPSSGRYAALDKAAEVQNAANIAGAENMQRNQDIATGQRLRSEAVQVGAQLPAAIANTANTAIQANTGASNASLANANTGANLNRLANEYLRTAMDIKLPLSGQKSSSSGGSNSSSPNNDRSGGGGGGQRPGGGGGGDGYGGGRGGPAWMPNHGDGQRSGGNTPMPRNFGSNSAGIMNIRGNNDPGIYENPYSPDWDGGDFDYLNDMQNDWNREYGFGDISGGQGYIGDQVFDSFDYGGMDPFGNSGFGQEFDYGGPYQTFGGIGNDYNDMGLGNLSYDPAANAVDPGWGDNSGYDPSGWDQIPLPSSYNDGGGDVWSGGSSYNDYGGGGSYFGADYGGGGGSYTDDSSYYTWSDGDAYAKGGQVRPQPQQQQQQQRMVPPQASPSGGAQTDDVRANLNVGEFVIPEDVVRWKGAEFFHKLLSQARKQRATGQQGVGGQPMPAGDPRAKGPATFSTTR